MSPTNQRRRRRGGRNHGQPAYNRPAIYDDRYGPPPGPPPAYPAHDIYNPVPGGDSYAPGYSNEYAPPSEPWHPEPAYYPRPPSPDIYSYPPGPAPSSWAPPSWEEPPPPQWANGIDTGSRFDNDHWSYERRDATTMAQPMFEPSEAWKQSHAGAPATTRNDVAPEPYSPSRRFAPRVAGDHYSPNRPLANDQYPLPMPAPPYPGDYFPQSSNLPGPPPNDRYDLGANLGTLPPSGNYDLFNMGSSRPPFNGAHNLTGSGSHAPPFSGGHYSPPQELPTPPLPFSGDHYSPGRSLNGPPYNGDRYERETPLVYPYVNSGSDGYRPRYEETDARAPHPPNPRVLPRWRPSSPERTSQPSPGRVPFESPGASARKWEMNRRASLQSPNGMGQWTPPPLARETVRAPSRGRSVTRSPSHSRARSPLYSPHASPVSFRGRPRSPSPSHSPVYSPRASLSPTRVRDQSPARGSARSSIHGRGRSPESVRGRTRSPIRGRARSPLSPRSYVARLGRSRSRPPETYRPGISRTRSPSVPRYRRRLPSYSRSRSRSSSVDSYRGRHTSSHFHGRSRSRRSVSGTRGKARSHSNDRSRSRVSTLYSPTTSRLYSPVLSRKQTSGSQGKGRSRERNKRRGKKSDLKSGRSASPPEDDLYLKPKTKRTRSVESTGSIYGPEIPPELRTKQAVPRSRDSSLSSYRSDNGTAKQQTTSIPGLSEVEQGVSATSPKATQAQITPPPVIQVTSTSPSNPPASGASDAVRVQHQGLSNGTSLNDELRAAVAKLVSEHSTRSKETDPGAVGDATTPPKDGVPKLSVQIPGIDPAALPEKKTEDERGEYESDMDVSAPATPTDVVHQPVKTVPTTVTVSQTLAPATALPPCEDVAAQASVSMSMVSPADLASSPMSQTLISTSAAASVTEESRTKIEARTLPPVDEHTAGEDSDVDMDVDMDMSAPPSPILKTTSPSIAPSKDSIDPQDVLSKPYAATTVVPVVGSVPAASSHLNAQSLTLATGDLPEAPGMASAASDDSGIPGLSLAGKIHPGSTAPDIPRQSRDDKLQATIQDKRAVHGPAPDDEQPVRLPPAQERGKPPADHMPSSPATEVPIEEAECDMDMSPPPSPSPSPVPQSPAITQRSSVGILQPTSLPLLEKQSPIAVEPPASSTATPVEAAWVPLPQTTKEGAAPAATSPAAAPIPVLAALDVAVSGTPTNDSCARIDAAHAPSPAPRKDASPEVQGSREGSPMVVESLLGLTEPPPIAESSVVLDDAVMAEGSPTVVDSMPISPIVQGVSYPEQQRDEPNKEPLRKLVEVGSEQPMQTSAPAKPTKLMSAAADGTASAQAKIADREAHSERLIDQPHTEAATEDADPLIEGLRTVVMKRLQLDRQTREERVAPVLLGNLAVAEPFDNQKPSADRLCHEVLHGKRKREREESFARVRPCLQSLFAQRQASLTVKVQKLKDEYLSLHDRWMIHCAKLDESAKALALEEAAANAGRTTRRSAAMGDAVRTDLEMEQIIASLGNEELTDANHLAARNAATIPDMIAVTKGSVDYLYDDTNNVVEDLANFYTPNTCLEDWTDEEKETFLEKYALYPKQFGIIADFLPNKTAAECVTYYYLHKKTLIDFRKVLARNTTGKRKRGGGRGGKKKGNALLEDIRKHDAEVSRDSTPSGPTTRRRRGAQQATNENGEPLPRRASTRKSVVQAENSPGTTPAATPDPDPEPRRRRRAPRPTARAVAATEQDGEEEATEAEPKPAKRTRRSRKVKSAETVESPVMSEAPLLFNETRFIDQTELTARKRTPTGSIQWTDEDKELFIKLLAQHGDDFKRISASMPNKTAIQLSVYYKANVAELSLDKVAAKGRKGTPAADSASEGYKEMSLPGSGIITPTTRASTPSVQPASSSSNNFEAQFRLDDPTAVYKSKLRASASNGAELERPSSRPGSSLAFSSSSSSSLSNLQFRSASLETLRAQYSGHDLNTSPFTMQSRLSPFASVNPPPLTMNNSPFVESARAAGSASGPLTMTFPSNFAYSNLSPSHFTSEQRPPPRGYGAASGSAPTSATMMFEASVFAPPPDGAGGFAFGRGDAPPVPATLQTTEDLVAYLEHRTRLAEQRESDFM